MEKEIITINGKTISYYANKGSGAPVFFIHGNSAGGEVFLEQFQDAALNNFRCIAIDLPGCGLSFKTETPAADYSVLNLTDILVQFIASFNSESYSIVAHSLGGHIILESLDKLKGLQKLIIFGTPPLGNTGTELTPFQNNAAVPFFFAKNLTDDQKGMMSENLINTASQHSGLIAQLLSKADGQLRETLGVEAGSGKLKDEVAEFKNAACEKYILHGEKDALINFEYVSLLKDFCSDKQIHVIGNSTHYPQLENPKVFNKILIELLGSEVRSGGA